ncbi:MAG: RNA-binding protein [Desulfobacterium sp.]|nr:RNA-binding protein [Desulfobacterium sp.]
MKKLIEIIARSLVDQPDQVSVTEIDGMHSSILELRVAKADIGKVIGKKGRTADALRTIVNAASAKIKKRTVLEIMD